MIIKDLPLALSYDDVLLVPQYSKIDSRSDVDVSTEIAPGLKLDLPLVSTKMDTVTGVEMAVAMGKLGGMGILPRFDRPEAQADQVRQVAKAGVIAAAAIGVKEGFLERALMLVKAGAGVINVDVAHGHMQKTLEATRALRRKFGKKIVIISGIVATAECARDLYAAGADSLLVGVGAGSICTTRIKTGCGLPGLASLWEVAPVARKLKKTFLPDAGIRNSGDIVKALASGASAIVAGSIFAGTDETPGEVVVWKNKKYKRYNGSTSPAEKEGHLKRYAEDKGKMYLKHLEGVEAWVPYKGPLEEVILQLMAGIRSGMAYCGAKNIKELWKRARFVQISADGSRENGAHDVISLEKR